MVSLGVLIGAAWLVVSVVVAAGFHALVGQEPDATGDPRVTAGRR